MSDNFKRFTYTKGMITNIVFKREYQDSVTKFLVSLSEYHLNYVEFSNELYEKIKNDIYGEAHISFTENDIVFIDANKFGAIKIKVILALLEQIFYKKAIIVFSSYVLELPRLNLMKVDVLELGPDKEKKKTQPIQAISEVLQKVEEKVLPKEKRIKKKNVKVKSHASEKKDSPEITHKSLVKHSINLFFLFFFTLLSSLSGFFAFSNTRVSFYNNTISASVLEAKSGKTDYFISTLLSVTNFSDVQTTYDEVKTRDGDYVSFVSFMNGFKEKTTNEELNPILLPGDTKSNRNFKRFDLDLMLEDDIETPAVEDEITFTKAYVPSSLIRSLNNLGETDPLDDYLGTIISTNYSFKQINFLVANIITNESSYPINEYYQNNMIIFSKPTELDNYSMRLVTMIRNDSAVIKDYFEPYYDNYTVTDYHEFSYLDQNDKLVTSDFFLNQILNELMPKEENYLIEILFIIISLLLAYFSVSITLHLQKLFNGQLKEIIIISALPLIDVILVFIGLNIYKAASGYSITSLALSNVFGIVFSILLALVLAGIVWYPTIQRFVKSKINK